MIKEKSKGLLIVVSGPSGVGKDTVCNKVVESMKDTKISVSMTSREPRGKEVDGVDYYFISKEEFEECDEIRFQYKNHDGLYLMLYIYGVDGDYYLDSDYVDDVENHKWHKIKPEYIALLTSAIPKDQ